jgi:chromosome segregation ATPase
MEAKPSGPVSAPKPGRLDPRLAELQRRVEKSARELEREAAERRGLEERLRELSRRDREIEERAGVFQREAVAGSELIAELQKTLRVTDQARAKLSAALERQGIELERWRREAAAREAEVQRLKQELERAAASCDDARAELAAERQRLLAEVGRAMENAEAIRREGIDAFEQARELESKSPRD